MTLLLIAHIVGGSLGLLGLVAAGFAKKGGTLHRRAGRVFSWAMGLTLLSGVIASLKHLLQSQPELNLFALLLLQAALLTGAGLDFGRLALVAKQKSRSFSRLRSLTLPSLLALASVGLASVSLPRGNILLTSFAALGLALSVGQVRHWFKRDPGPKEWLVAHVSGMGTAGIGAVTAFGVVNAARLFPGVPALVVWLLPGVLGGIWIGVVTQRLKRGNVAASSRVADSVKSHVAQPNTSSRRKRREGSENTVSSTT
ncbi:MAG: hypothetical protein H6718_17120 [Polyangiaceae bacterium]|nr:hypothetical protein [Myxococcales bacterium]MCB9587123.1 hypothetical protein [Polyangiaceae bacterium]